MIKVGLTGGMGSGKSTVASIFKTLGIPVYDADSNAKRLMRSDQELKSKIKSLLGNESYHKNGYPNRAYIAKKIFGDKKLLTAINELVHPAVRIDMLSWFKQNSHHPYAVYEAAIIIDHHQQIQFDKIIVVETPLDLRIERILNRDKRNNRTAIKKRIANQLSDEDRRKHAHFIVINIKRKDLLPQVLTIHESLIKQGKT